MKQLMKQIAAVMGILFFLSAPIIAADAPTTEGGFTQLEKGGNQAKQTTRGIVASWKWLLMLGPLAATFLYYRVVGKYLMDKEENNQSRPQVVKIFLYVMAVFAGVLSAFMVYGIVGIVFLDYGFGETWTEFIVKPWREILVP